MASSSTHRDALIRALSKIGFDTTATPEGLIHFLTADRATYIVFSDNDLPPEGSSHVHPLLIDVSCSGRKVSPILLDNDSALNICPLVTTIALGFSPSDFKPSTQTSELMTRLRGQLWAHQHTFHDRLGKILHTLSGLEDPIIL